METTRIVVGVVGLVATVLLMAPPLVWGHCDTLDGPVVVDAKAALAKGDIAPVMKWIPASGEHDRVSGRHRPRPSLWFDMGPC